MIMGELVAVGYQVLLLCVAAKVADLVCASRGMTSGGEDEFRRVWRQRSDRERLLSVSGRRTITSKIC